MRVVRATKSFAHTLLAHASAMALLSALAHGSASAHTVSIGYAFASPGAVNLWYGSYHDDATFNEANVQLVGPSFNQTVNYTLLSAIKPTGLIDGVNNFYSNTAGTALVGTPQIVASTDGSGGAFDPATQSVINWQGASFTGLRPGTYTFTYNPLALPTVEWHPINTIIETNSFTLTAADVLGIDSFAAFGRNVNQHSVAAGLDTSINAGAFNQTFYNLAALPPAALANALTQLSGEPLTQTAQAGFQSMSVFLTTMLDPWSGAGDARGADFGANPGGLSPAGVPYGSSPNAGDPYGAAPYGASPYGSSPYGNSPYGTSPYGSSPYGTPQSSNSQYGNNPYGNNQYGNNQYGNSQYGNSQNQSQYGNDQYANAPQGAARRYVARSADQRCGTSPDGQTLSLDPCWGLWVTPYGGYSAMTGNAAIGSHDTTMRAGGMIAGLDYRFAPGSVVGAAMAAGTTSWGLADSLGGGRSDSFQLGLYASRRFSSAYISAAFAYGWQQIATNRTVTISGTDQLAGDYKAQGLGGRVEIGNRFVQNGIGVTPYVAGQIQSWQLPAYGETASSGSSVYALSVDARNANNARTEVGAWIDRMYDTDSGRLQLRGRAAWIYDIRNAPVIDAAFQAMPNSNFTVTGVAPEPNALLVSLAAELRLADGWSVGSKFDGELAQHSQTFTGTGTLRYQW